MSLLNGFMNIRTYQSLLSADANRAVGKEQQIMADDEFPEEYLLTVFPFSTDVSVTLFLHA